MIKNRTSKVCQAGSQCHARLTLAIILIAVTLLAACNGGSKPASSGNQPAATSSICLEGIWSIRHPETYFRYSLPPGAFDLTTLTFKASIGGIAYRFDNKGVLTIEAVGFDGKLRKISLVRLVRTDASCSPESENSFSSLRWRGTGVAPT